MRSGKFYLSRKFISEPRFRVLRPLPGTLDFCVVLTAPFAVMFLTIVFGFRVIFSRGRSSKHPNKSMSHTSQQNVQGENAIRTDDIYCSKGVVQFIQKYRWSQVRSIERSLQLFDVVVNAFGFENKLCVSAKADGLGTALEKVKVLIDKVICENFEIEQPGIARYCSKGRLDSLVKMVMNEEKCYVLVEKKFLESATCPSSSESAVAGAGSPSTNGGTAGVALGVDSSDTSAFSGSSVVFTSLKGHKVSWKIGDIALEQAHTLVCPEGVCSKAILAAAGPDIAKVLQLPQQGEITLTPGYQLLCKHVLHTCCSKWNGGKGEAMLQSIVQKSLNKVAELGGSSIAFPLIGSGNLGFPSRDASRIMLDEAVKFCLNDSQSLVRDIRFVLFHGDQRVIDAFKLESAALQARFYTTVEVVQDDLTKQTTDAIVNVIRSDMNMRSAGELGKAVAQASGAQVEAECARLGHQPEGTAVITSGGNLAALNIVHMVVTGSASKKTFSSVLRNVFC